MVKKVVTYTFVFLLSVLIFLVMTLPASVLWNKALSSQLPLKQLGVKVIGLEGTVWDGRAKVRYQHVEGIVSWDIGLGEVWLGKLLVDLGIESPLASFDASATLSPSSISVSLPSAEILLSQVSPFLRRERISLSGEVLLNGLELTLEDRMLVSAQGKGSWSGGEISYPVGRKMRQPEMPAMFVNLYTGDDGIVKLDIRDADADFDVIDATLNKEGEVLLQVKRRLLDLAGEQARHKNETDVVFKVKKPLIRH